MNQFWFFPGKKEIDEPIKVLAQKLLFLVLEMEPFIRLTLQQT
jgi:hypothetical protein